MEYLQRALQRIIPDHQEIAEAALAEELFAPHLLREGELDSSLCMLLDGGKARQVAFLAERSGGRRRQMMTMPLEAGQPAAVMANYVGHIQYIPAGEYYYNDLAKLRLGVGAAARGFARQANNDLLMLLCAAAPRPHRASDGWIHGERSARTVARQLLGEMRSDGLEPDILVLPQTVQTDGLDIKTDEDPEDGLCHPRLLGRLGSGERVWSATGLRRVVAVDTQRAGQYASGPVRVLLGAHNQRNAYWIIVGRYVNAVVEEPRAIRWARL